MSIGDKIRNKRVELGLSQDELATLVGYSSRSSINKIEVDGRGVPADKLLAISSVLGVTPTFLLGFDSREYDTEIIKLISLTNRQPVIKDLLPLLEKASDEDLALIKEVLERFVNKES